MYRHEGVQCNGCWKRDFSGVRYKCLRCYDYDLCTACHFGNAHPDSHPMQDIDFLHASGQLFLTCPYCNTKNLGGIALFEHVVKAHFKLTSLSVLCPLCVKSPYCHPNYFITDLARHMAIAHRIGNMRIVSPIPEVLDENPSGSDESLAHASNQPEVKHIDESVHEIQSPMDAPSEAISERSTSSYTITYSEEDSNIFETEEQPIQGTQHEIGKSSKTNEN